jgi:hypothetical protein
MAWVGFGRKVLGHEKPRKPAVRPVLPVPIAVVGDVGSINGGFRGERIHTPDPLLPIAFAKADF